MSLSVDDEDDGGGKPAAQPLPFISTIWEDDMISKYDLAGKKGWRCHWCDSSFPGGYNTTKAIYHLNKVRKRDIAICSSTIDKGHAQRYKLFLDKLMKKQGRLGKTKKGLIDLSCEAPPSPKRQRQSPLPASLSSLSHSPHISHSISTTSKTEHKRKKYVQLTVTNESPNPTTERKLTNAIANMIYSLSLPFSFADEQKFHNVLHLARTVPKTYKPPNRKQIAGHLLDSNFDDKMKSNYDILTKDADVYGLCLYGDGATVKKMPLINILGSGAYNTAVVLQIADFTSHMQSGGIKDATYIADLFLPHCERLDPSKENLDLFYFDGAGNVQKGGEILTKWYPRATVLHGTEHVISLFFADLA
jgi:hypothetical protein